MAWNRTERTGDLTRDDWVGCDDGWVYDQTTFDRTIVSEVTLFIYIYSIQIPSKCIFILLVDSIYIVLGL